MDTPAKKICGAKTRRGGTCKQPVIPGRNRCHYHGGKNIPAGPLHPTWKHGRTSLWKAMPQSMKADFEEALDDPELVSLRQNLAAVDAMISERTRSIGDTRIRWNNLAELAEAMETAGSDEEFLDAKADLMDAIIVGKNQISALDELASLHERRSRIAAAEVKRLTSQQQSLTLAEAVQLMHSFVTQLMLVIRDTVDDRNTLKQLRQTLSERNLLDGRAFIESLADSRRGN